MSPSHDHAPGQVMRGRSSCLLAALVATLLAGCAGRGDTVGSVPVDYRQRHPIELVRANETLDVFVGNINVALDERQQADVQEFARNYMRNGQGPLVAYLPVGGNTPGVNSSLNAIRKTLGNGGANGRLQIAQYHPEAAGPVAPIKLAFAKLKAETPTRCGYEAEDIVPTRYATNAVNTSAANFGCSYQKNLAAQIADPRDLVRPRQEGPVDADKRLASIQKLRENGGKDLLLAGKTVKQIAAE